MNDNKMIKCLKPMVIILLFPREVLTRQNSFPDGKRTIPTWFSIDFKETPELTVQRTILKKNQLTELTEKHNDLTPATYDHEWYGPGSDYQLSGMTKVLPGVKIPDHPGGNTILADTPLPVFFN